MLTLGPGGRSSARSTGFGPPNDLQGAVAAVDRHVLVSRLRANHWLSRSAKSQITKQSVKLQTEADGRSHRDGRSHPGRSHRRAQPPDGRSHWDGRSHRRTQPSTGAATGRAQPPGRTQPSGRAQPPGRAPHRDGRNGRGRGTDLTGKSDETSGTETPANGRNCGTDSLGVSVRVRHRSSSAGVRDGCRVFYVLKEETAAVSAG